MRVLLLRRVVGETTVNSPPLVEGPGTPGDLGDVVPKTAGLSVEIVGVALGTVGRGDVP